MRSRRRLAARYHRRRTIPQDLYNCSVRRGRRRHNLIPMPFLLSLMRRIALACLATMILTTAGYSQDRLSLPYQQFELDNGLTVILHQDTTAPVLATSIWYHVGS